VCLCLCLCDYLAKICFLLVDAENGRAYPDYLVRYYRGNRDPKRTPYVSKHEGMQRSNSQKGAKPEAAVDEMDADTMEIGLVHQAGSLC
jgi:hypothetical protein